MNLINKTYRLFAGMVVLLILTVTVSNAGTKKQCDKISQHEIAISEAGQCSDEVLSDSAAFQFQANPEISYNISQILVIERSFALLPNRNRTNKGFLSYPKN